MRYHLVFAHLVLLLPLARAAALEKPRVDHQRGFDVDSFTLTLTAPAGATLRYTLDGSRPDAEYGTSAGNSVSLPVDGITVLRAVAIDGSAVSPVLTHSYLFIDDVLAQGENARGIPNDTFDYGWGSTEMRAAIVAKHRATIEQGLVAIPSLLVTGSLDGFFDADDGIMVNQVRQGREWERRVALEIIDPVADADHAVECGYQVAGRGSAFKEKKPGELIFRSEYGPGTLAYPLFPGSHAAGIDKVRLRLGGTTETRTTTQYGQQWIDDLQIAASGDGQYGRMVHLYINGAYWGLYNALETASSGFGEEHIGGDKAEWDAIRSRRPVDGDRLAWQVLDGLAPWDDADHAATGRAYLDLQQYIDYRLLGALFEFELDMGIEHRFLRNRHTGVGFRAFPWDTDVSAFPFAVADWDRPVSTDFSGVDSAGDLWADAEARVLVGDRIHRHYCNGGTLTSTPLRDAFLARYQESAAALRADEARWLGRWFSDERTPVADRDAVVDDFVPNRPAHVLQHFQDEGIYPALAAPDIDPFGGDFSGSIAVTLADGGSGTLYYTLDGRDPRLAGGALAPDVASGGTTVTLDETTVIKARMKQGDSWSALSEAVFRHAGDDLAALLPSELMYHPRDADDPRPSGWRVRVMPAIGGYRRAGDLAQESVLGRLDADWGTDTSPVPGASDGKFALLADGYLIPDATGTATLAVTVQGMVDVWVDGDHRVDEDVDGDATTFTVDHAVERGEPVRVAVQFFRSSDGDAASLRVAWSLDGADRGLLAGDAIACDAKRAEDYAFIELHNSSAHALDLSGCTLADGIRYRFAPGSVVQGGERIVLVSNPRLFAERYPNVAIYDNFAGSLSDGGERVALHDADGAQLWSFTYGDSAPWPRAADGAGASLVFTGGALDAAANWAASAAVDGGPGVVDAPAGDGAVLINEALTHSDLPATDAVELVNPSAANVDISGWLLADNRDGDDAWTIPSPTVIPAGEYLLFEEDDFGDSFRLSSRGEEVWLLGTGSAATYAHGFVFDAAATGVSFARHVISTGAEHFVAQQTNSLGAANTGPRVGPVVISEILYHPTGNDVEYVELVNVSQAAVTLYDAQHGNAWRLAGTGFEFPANTVLPAGGVAVLTAGDPASFRSVHGIPSEVLVLGPMPGRLSNGGELLALRRPDGPEEVDGETVVPMITVDAVDYDDDGWWPREADTDGLALVRNLVGAYGDDPANWQAAAPSPGSVDLTLRRVAVDVTPGAGVEATMDGRPGEAVPVLLDAGTPVLDHRIGFGIVGGSG